MNAVKHNGGAAADVSGFLLKNGWKVMEFLGVKPDKDTR